MNSPCLQKVVVIRNAEGMHARPATLMARLAMKYQSKITLVKDNQPVDCRSILDLLTLGAPMGTEIRIEATGSDAESALEAVADLVAKKFFED